MAKRLDKGTKLTVNDILKKDDMAEGIQEVLANNPVGMLVVYSDSRGFHALQIGELNVAEVVGMGAMLKNWTEDILYDSEGNDRLGT